MKHIKLFEDFGHHGEEEYGPTEDNVYNVRQLMNAIGGFTKTTGRTNRLKSVLDACGILPEQYASKPGELHVPEDFEPNDKQIKDAIHAFWGDIKSTIAEDPALAEKVAKIVFGAKAKMDEDYEEHEANSDYFEHRPLEDFIPENKTADSEKAIKDFIDCVRAFAFDYYHDEEQGSESDANDLMDELEERGDYKPKVKSIEEAIQCMSSWGVKKDEFQAFLTTYLPKPAKEKEYMKFYNDSK